MSAPRRADAPMVRAALGSGNKPRTVVAAACAIVFVGVGFLVAVLATPVWPYILAVAGLCMSAVALRYGWAWAFVTVSVVATTALYGLSMVSAAIGAPFHVAMASVVGATGLLALRHVFLNGGARAPRASALWIGAVPLGWLGAAALGAGLPGGSRWDWALMGDSANNVLFARDVILDHGAPLGGDNPVPLPHIAVALGMSGGGTSAAAGDIASYASVWHLLIVASSVSAGILGRHVALRLGVKTWSGIAVATVLPAAVVISWAATGNALRFGFINAHLSVFLVVLCLLAGLLAPKPVLGFVVQVMVAVDLLATWSPLAVIPAAMAMFHLVPVMRRGFSRREWWYLGVAGTLGLGYALVTAVAARVGLRTVFSSNGGVWAPSLRTISGVIVILLVVGFVISRRAQAVGRWVMTVALAMVASLAGTLVLAMGAWTYYPMKMAWFALTIAGLVLAALAVPILTVVVPRAAPLAPAVALVVGLVLVLGPPVASHGTARSSWIVEPVTALVAPVDGGGDQLYGLVEALGTDSDSVALLWQSGARYEREVDFWVLNEASGRFSESQQGDERFAVRALAYAQFQPADIQLCGAQGFLGAPVIVYTADPSLEGRIRDTCGVDAPTIQMLDAADPNLIARVLANQ